MRREKATGLRLLHMVCGHRQVSKTTGLVTATLLCISLSLAGGCDSGRGRESRGHGREGQEACIQTTMCADAAHWDPYRCACVVNRTADGGLPCGSGPCVQTVLCTPWAHWDFDRCRCVPNPADGGAGDSADGAVDSTEGGAGKPDE